MFCSGSGALSQRLLEKSSEMGITKVHATVSEEQLSAIGL